MASEPNAPAFARELNESEGEPVNAWWELVKWLAFQNSEFTLPSIGLALLEKFVTPEHPDHQKFLNMCDDLSNELEVMIILCLFAC